MGKLATLVSTIFLALASASGCWYLTVQINAGETRIAEGQEEIAAGRAKLKAGKARLAEGKQELAEGKDRFQEAKKDTVIGLLRGDEEEKELSDAERLKKLAEGGRDYQDARERIAEGERQVAEGERKVKAGEKRLSEGEQQLQQGKSQLELARQARLASAIAAVLFGILSMVLAIVWRRSLFRHRH